MTGVGLKIFIPDIPWSSPLKHSSSVSRPPAGPVFASPALVVCWISDLLCIAISAAEYYCKLERLPENESLLKLFLKISLSSADV